MRRDGCEGGAWGWAAERGRAGGEGVRTLARTACMGRCLHSSLGVHACVRMSVRMPHVRACMRACGCECAHARTPHHQLRGGCAGQCRHGHITQWHRQAGQGVVGCGVDAPCWVLKMAGALE